MTKNIKSNFKGNWEDLCEYCNTSHKEHISSDFIHEGYRYIHRMPCENELLQRIIPERQSEVNRVKFIIFGFNLGQKIWTALMALFFKWWWEILTFLWENKFMWDIVRGKWNLYRLKKKY